MNPSPSERTSLSPVPSLQRGKACLACRRRKMRCDGVRPVCGQCVRGSRVDDCEYTDGQRRSRTQTLEEDIVRLRARVQELEHPEQETPMVPLYDPYQQAQSSAALSSRSLHLSGHSSNASSPGTSSAESLAMYTLTGGIPDAIATWWTLKIPPHHILQTALETFMPYAVEFGLFLDYHRFSQAALENTVTRTVPPVLLNTIILWYLQVSRSEELFALETTILPRVSQQLAEAMTCISSQTMLYVLQAEVFLGYFFLRKGRPLEARYHCSAAVTLAVGYRLHIGPDAPQTESMFNDLFPAAMEISSPVDLVEESERIDAFWTIFTLDRTSSVILNTPPNLYTGTSGVQITVPWPLAVPSQENGGVVQDDTLVDFFSGSQAVASEDLSMLALQAQAAALLERAGSMARQYNSVPRITENIEWLGQFTTLDNLIDRFLSLLPPIDHAENRSSSSNYRRLLAIHTFSAISTIQLHHIFRSSHAPSNEKSIAAARTIASVLDKVNTRGLGYFNPAMATSWVAATFVLNGELTRLKAIKASWATVGLNGAPGGEVSEGEAELESALRKILAALDDLALNCPRRDFWKKFGALLLLFNA
ncbi:hypothetical protein BJ138DRAFT_1091644 [Hygrophoropsis aurantiaca]|uniref:Uncharacterized protein n=1 Tax=Hygrophoropsis aurantiaca TaxID=72124 RepID=A0ACB8A457_9AGAM|nr:hypothetical protein BJ138DRAFT_1091644 [Hygrophoropsis aurantiaca]